MYFKNQIEMNRIVLFIAGLVAFLFTACDRPECTNTNPVFEEHTHESVSYKNELRDEVNRIGINNLRFWLDSYVKRGEQEYILVNVQGKGLCAIAELEVDEWGKLKGIQEKKGVTYRGAELVGLTFDFIQNGEFVQLSYTGVDHILD